MRRHALSGTFVLAMTIVGSPVQAQNDAGRERALALFEQSEQAYNAGELERAVSLLREAHATYPEPILLYNLGRALEGLGRMGEAADAYERYLAAAPPDIRDRAAITRRIAALRRSDALANRTPARRRPPEPSPSPAGVDGSLAAGWSIAGLGAVGLVATIPLGVLALERRDAAEVEPDATRAWSLSGEAQDLALATNVTLAIAGAVLLVGVVWGIVALASSGGSTDRARLDRIVRF